MHAYCRGGGRGPRYYTSDLRPFVCMLPTTVTRSSSCVVAIRYVLPVFMDDIIFARGGSVAEWLACWTQAQKGLGSNRVTVLGKLFTPIVHLFTKQRNW